MGSELEMARYEYKVVAAPRKAKSFKGVRAHEDQFAEVLAEVMNKMAREDWQYLRAESLPCEERSGLTSRVEGYQSVLVFRRKIVDEKKFFEVPPQQQIEHQQIREDVTEAEAGFVSRRAATVTPVGLDGHEMVERPASAGVLGILQTRKARMAQDEGDYPEYMKQAAE